MATIGGYFGGHLSLVRKVGTADAAFGHDDQAATHDDAAFGHDDEAAARG